MRVRDLRPLFAPRSVAVLGASDDPAKWGQWIAAGALRGAHRRDVWLVNRKGGEILGREAYRSLAELPGEPELVVISLPAAAFEEAIDASLAVGARAIVAITAGLGEIDDAGRAREAAVVERVRAAGAVMLGPNCLGVYDAAADLDLGSNEFTPGALGIISQSGNLALELSLLAADYGVGVSRFASLGNQADIEAAELVDAFAADEHTRVIGVYCEDFRDGRAFARAGAAAVAAGKQVVLLAAGGSEAGARAAASHTGALASDAAAVEAACRASGILGVATPKQLVDRALASLAPHRPRGRRVAIVGDGGGTGVVTADLVTQAGLELPRLSTELAARLTAIAPSVITTNPGRPGRSGRAGLLELRARHERGARIGRGRCGRLHRLLRWLQPDERGIQRRRDGGRARDRPLGGGERPPARVSGDVLGFVSRPRPAGRTVCLCTATSRLPSTPSRSSWSSARRPAGCSRARRACLARRRRRVLRIARSSCRDRCPVRDRAEGGLGRDGARRCSRLGYPVALKALGLLHKSDAGGVALGLEDDRAVAAAAEDMQSRLAPEGFSVEELVDTTDGVELIVGCRRDARFGPLVLVGLGGVYAELLRDVRVALAPAGADELEALLLCLRGAGVLTGARGQAPVDVRSAAEVAAALSRVAAAHPEIAEIEINPLLATPAGAVGLDARIVLV